MTTETSNAVVNASGGIRNAIDCGLELNRILWSLAFPEHGEAEWHGKKWPRDFGSPEQVVEKFGPERGNFAKAAIEALRGHRLCGASGFALPTLKPLTLLRALIGGARPEHDLTYFMMRSLRDHHGCILSSGTLAIFNKLVSAMRGPAIHINTLGPKDSSKGSRSVKCSYWECLVPALEAALSEPLHCDHSLHNAQVMMFLDFSRALGYVEATGESGRVKVWGGSADGEFVLSNVFGMRTSIAGFDELFGGGLVLADSCGPARDWYGARGALIMGRCGTGKSCLAQQIAVEVASKGGVSWVMPLEQSQEECLFSMTSMGLLAGAGTSFEVVTDSSQLLSVLNRKHPDKGILIILGTVKNDFGDFLTTLEQNSRLLERMPFRLLVADPINGIARSAEEGNRNKLRTEIVGTLQRVKQTGTNLLLVAEEREDLADDFMLDDSVADVENIADLVIRLSVDSTQFGYSQRFLEVRKSRYQRQHRGRHPFRMRAGIGFEIYPSSAAIAARVSTRSYREPDTQTEFGFEPLDSVLGPRGLFWGDVVAFHGPGGSLKTAVSMFFACARNSNIYESTRGGHLRTSRKTRSLIFAARDSESTVREFLDRPFIQTYSKSHGGKQSSDVEICALPKGYIKSGEIFQAIESEFLKARMTGYSIDRVLIDNISHWEMSCPYIASDLTFADTLVDFLRRQGVTSLLICGSETGASSTFQRPMIDNADCVVRFDRFQFRGVDRTTIRVQKTRGMEHRREAFELDYSANSLSLKPNSSLLRVIQGQEVKTVKVRLFLHAESEIQTEYHKSLRNSIAGVLSRETELESQDRVYMAKAMTLGAFSSVDELQLLQLDEFQFEENPRPQIRADVPLYKFPSLSWQKEEWDDFLPILLNKVRSQEGDFVALPYYGNLSFLAYRQIPELTQEVVSSWHALAEVCTTWERKEENQDPSKLFFEFPRATWENYNSIFFEILLGLPNKLEGFTNMCLREWMADGLCVEASLIMRTLCRKAYLTGGGEDQARAKHVVVDQPKNKLGEETTPANAASLMTGENMELPSTISVRSDAVVWRHWYTTLNQMLSIMKPEATRQIVVTSLPGGVSTAGEWYLALPIYSAAPDVGIQMIGMMASREAELNRLRLGIGLPTRGSFYDRLTEGNVEQTPISPYFSMPVATVHDLMLSAFRRSRFGCYLRVHQILAHHLKRVIELPDQDSVQQLQAEVRCLLNSAKAQMEFVRIESDCRQCKVNQQCWNERRNTSV